MSMASSLEYSQSWAIATAGILTCKNKEKYYYFLALSWDWSGSPLRTQT
jgi:hypothetical protein